MASHKIKILLFSLLLIFLSGCSGQDGGKNLPDTLRIGVLPDESPEMLQKRYQPLFDHLSAQLGINCELVIPASYAELLTMFGDKRIDIANFGGVTFLKAHKQYHAVPLVMRDIDMRFTSYFLVRADEPGQKVTDYRNRPFSFGSRLSTSGHLMPRYFLQIDNIEPEAFFSRIEYSGKHDKTAYDVRDRVVDIGVANAAIIDKMFASNQLSKNEIKILYETPPYADYVWAIRDGFNDQARFDITKAFLSLSPVNHKHAAILANIDAGGFLPASMNDFAMLDSILSAMDLE